MKIKIVKEVEIEFRFLQVSAKVRYWEDSEINGESDIDGKLTPFAHGDLWIPLIDIEKGIIVDWPKGTTAWIHFKVCDEGSYQLRDNEMNVVAAIYDDYVPRGLCHGSEGYGDYIIMDINEDGSIVGYRNSINAVDWSDDVECPY